MGLGDGLPGSDRSGLRLLHLAAAGSRATSVKTGSTGLSPESESGLLPGGAAKGRWGGCAPGVRAACCREEQPRAGGVGAPQG